MSTTYPVVIVSGRKIAIDVPHLTFVTLLSGWAAWFCWDASHASATVENLILILPISVVAIVLYFFVAADCFHRVPAGEEKEPFAREPLARGMAVRIAGSMALLAGFVVAGPLIGFDIASFAYTLGMMAFLGERRIWVLLLVPLLFSAVVIYCFSTLLSTPLPLFFGERA